MAAGTETTEDILLASLRKFYDEDPHHATTLCRVLGPRSPLSLRVLDWLVTTYAKQKRTTYLLADGKPFSLYLSYKTTLKSYSKKYFDIFRRQKRIQFEARGMTLETTVAQLNFMRWLIKNKVIEYCETHINDIEGHMTQELEKAVQLRSEAPENTKKRRRHGPAFSDCTTTSMRVRVTFD